MADRGGKYQCVACHGVAMAKTDLCGSSERLVGSSCGVEARRAEPQARRAKPEMSPVERDASTGS